MNTKNVSLAVAAALLTAAAMPTAYASAIFTNNGDINEGSILVGAEAAETSHSITVRATLTPPYVTWADPGDLSVTGVINRENMAILSTAKFEQAPAAADKHNGSGVCFVPSHPPTLTISNGGTSTTMSPADGLRLYVQAGADVKNFDGGDYLCVGGGQNPNDSDAGWDALAQFRYSISNGAVLPIGNITMTLPYYILAG